MSWCGNTEGGTAACFGSRSCVAEITMWFSVVGRREQAVSAGALAWGVASSRERECLSSRGTCSSLSIINAREATPLGARS